MRSSPRPSAPSGELAIDAGSNKGAGGAARTTGPEPTLSGWGRLPMPGREQLSEDLASATIGAVLSRGLGRSYGDSSLPARASDKVVGTRLANRILAFDPATALIRTEAGLSLAELNRLMM